MESNNNNNNQMNNINNTNGPNNNVIREYWVKDCDIELAGSKEIVSIQYFCNTENEPIYFPDRSLAALFNVNLSTLRGRFNRLTKKFEGYRLLISEKSKTRLSNNHFINWGPIPSSINKNNNNNNSNHNNSQNSSPSNSAMNSPVLLSQQTPSSPGISSTSISNTSTSSSSSPLHGLVALNHVKLVNIALSEWIATNHERLGTNLSHIEENFRRSDIPFKRKGEIIYINITQQDDLLPPFINSNTYYPSYFPRQHNSSVPTTPDFDYQSHQLQLQHQQQHQLINSNFSLSNSTQFFNFSVKQIMPSTSNSSTGYTPNNNNNNFNNQSSLKKRNTISPDLLEEIYYRTQSNESNSSPNSTVPSSPNSLNSNEDYDYDFIEKKSNEINSNNKKRCNPFEQEETNSYQSIQLNNQSSPLHRQPSPPMFFQKLNLTDTENIPREQQLSPKKHGTNQFYLSKSQNSATPSPPSLSRENSFGNSNNFNQQLPSCPRVYDLIDVYSHQSTKLPFSLNNQNNNENTLNSPFYQSPNQMRNRQQQYQHQPQPSQQSKWIECSMEGKDEIVKVNLSNICSYEQLKYELSSLFKMMSYTIHYSSIRQQFNNDHQVLKSLSIDNFNQFIDVVEKIYLRPQNTTPEIRNLINS
ncbi:hypothetical protein CYY_000637 [Polysphondylium violaceum]|uniref:AUX/IAA domain-containing protein n=1 Tax=Polysphondylium violaceum TaxID=133409 RepID=A0A8J4QAP1_9MYCE|nr:hypothetical protein CYY_000637 [Polysphondylium violaceum]